MRRKRCKRLLHEIWDFVFAVLCPVSVNTDPDPAVARQRPRRSDSDAGTATAA